MQEKSESACGDSDQSEDTFAAAREVSLESAAAYGVKTGGAQPSYEARSVNAAFSRSVIFRGTDVPSPSAHVREERAKPTILAVLSSFFRCFERKQ